VLRTAPVFISLAEIFAVDIAAADWSITLPDIDAFTCADAIGATANKHMKAMAALHIL
jgi:hypothetical protein